jgi:hypothetical protein
MRPAQPVPFRFFIIAGGRKRGKGFSRSAVANEKELTQRFFEGFSECAGATALQDIETLKIAAVRYGKLLCQFCQFRQR